MAGHEHLNPRLSKVMKKRQDRGVAELWLLNAACLFRRKKQGKLRLMPISICSRTRIKNADSEGQGSNLTE